MKTLQLKNENNFSHKEMLTNILKGAPEGGLSIDAVRKSVKALDALEKADKQVEWEDDIAEYVKQRVNETKFNVASKEIVTFCDDIENL